MIDVLGHKLNDLDYLAKRNVWLAGDVCVLRPACSVDVIQAARQPVPRLCLGIERQASMWKHTQDGIANIAAST
jgi:hypothetical protein